MQENEGVTKSSVVDYQPPQRTQSRDTRDVRDYDNNLRQTSGAKHRLQEDPIQYQQRSVSDLDRQENGGGVTKSSVVDYQPPKRTQSHNVRDNDNVRDNLRQSFDGKDRRLQDIQDRSQRLEEKINLEVKVSKNALKSGLKSPDTDRRRKSVSWSEECTPQGKGDNESGQKRKRQNFNDEAEL